MLKTGWSVWKEKKMLSGMCEGQEKDAKSSFKLKTNDLLHLKTNVKRI